MSIRESFEKAVMDGRTLVVIAVAAILWRAYISLNDTTPLITFWESFCSGIVLIIFSWVIFVYAYHMFRETTGWPISNWIYLGITVSLTMSY